MGDEKTHTEKARERDNRVKEGQIEELTLKYNQLN